MAEFGQFEYRVTFSRRPLVDGDPNRRGDDYSEQYLTVWANYARLSATAKVQAGAEIDDEVGTLTVRDSQGARQITAADRVAVRGRDFQVVNVGLPIRHTGLIAMTVSSDLGG